MTWKTIDSAPVGKEILVYYKNGCGKGRRIKAKYITKFTEESSDDPDYHEHDEYDEASDTFYMLEGWYELIDNWDDFSFVAIHNTPTHWHEMPELPTELST